MIANAWHITSLPAVSKILHDLFVDPTEEGTFAPVDIKNTKLEDLKLTRLQAASTSCFTAD